MFNSYPATFEHFYYNFKPESTRKTTVKMKVTNTNTVSIKTPCCSLAQAAQIDLCIANCVSPVYTV